MDGVGRSSSGGMTIAHTMTEAMTTPPVPSSPTEPGNDSMDISPLPHKAPYVAASRVEVRSPSPEKTPAVTMLSSPLVASETPLEVQIQTIPLE